MALIGSVTPDDDNHPPQRLARFLSISNWFLREDSESGEGGGGGYTNLHTRTLWSCSQIFFKKKNVKKKNPSDQIRTQTFTTVRDEWCIDGTLREEQLSCHRKDDEFSTPKRKESVFDVSQSPVLSFRLWRCCLSRKLELVFFDLIKNTYQK